MRLHPFSTLLEKLPTQSKDLTSDFWSLSWDLSSPQRDWLILLVLEEISSSFGSKDLWVSENCWKLLKRLDKCEYLITDLLFSFWKHLITVWFPFDYHLIWNRPDESWLIFDTESDIDLILLKKFANFWQVSRVVSETSWKNLPIFDKWKNLPIFDKSLEL